ncbi:myosin-binding protein 1 [Arachis duranensis]|uniref:Myosin-binding protein 1 n=1 Tax=Arachis duranensis TaxID=130453 RepID=A0A6P4DHQ5_ARADU|nr:myosin-binding protein 1 [Arachis duranensis]
MASSGVSTAMLSRNFSTSLASALLEWFLIFFLFVDAVFSYVITKFASYCKLQTPCLFCSRLDHVLGKQKTGFYWELICSAHKLEISSLVLCRAHDKLVNVQGICQNCLFSLANINKTNAEHCNLVGKFGDESASRFDQDPLLGDRIETQCSCCNEQRIFNSYDERLAFSKSIESEVVDLDELEAVRDSLHDKKRRAKPSVSFRVSNLRNSQLDPLSHVGYTEVKVTSDTESESELPLSEDDDTNIPVSVKDDTKEDVKLPCEDIEPTIIDLNKASGKPRSLAPPLEPLLSEPEIQLENMDTHAIKSVSEAMGSENNEEELDWQQAEKNADATTVSKESYELTTNEVGLASDKRSAMDCEEIIKLGNKQTTSEAGSEPNPVSSDSFQQNPIILDLGDAYKLAVGNKGRQLSGILAEQWLGKDSTRVSEDLKIMLSQFSATRGTDLSMNDISPRLSINSDEMKNSDVSNSTGMQILQKMISLERNESGLSLDGSIVSEIEGESVVDRLKRQVDHDRKLMSALYKELEEERNASAVAANQALAMITRLQEEKAALHMEALQYLRVMDEQSEYDTDALQKANDAISEKDREIEELEAKLDFYRKKFPDESMNENVLVTNFEMKVKDIGLDNSQCSAIESEESILGKSVTENPIISDKAQELVTSLEGENVQLVKNSSLKFQEERLYISERLKKLEKQVYLFLNMHHSEEKCINSESSGKESPVNCEKLDSSLMMPDSVSILKMNSDAKDCDYLSSKEPKDFDENGDSPLLCGNNDLASTGNVIHNFVGRLQIIEADLSFLEHSMNLLSNGDEGLKLLKEIADHLQQLRRIGIREIDQQDA